MAGGLPLVVHALDGGIAGAIGQDLIAGHEGSLEDGFALKLQPGATLDQPLHTLGVEGEVTAVHQSVGLVAGGGEHGLVLARPSGRQKEPTFSRLVELGKSTLTSGCFSDGQEDAQSQKSGWCWHRCDGTGQTSGHTSG